jgi:hypothetical protein
MRTPDRVKRTSAGTLLANPTCEHSGCAFAAASSRRGVVPAGSSADPIEPVVPIPPPGGLRPATEDERRSLTSLLTLADRIDRSRQGRPAECG